MEQRLHPALAPPLMHSPFKRSELHLIDLGGMEYLMDSYLTGQSFLCCYWVQQA